MHSRPTGPPRLTALLRRSRRANRRPRLFVLPAFLLTATVAALLDPARPEAAGGSTVKVVEASALSPLAHEGGDTGTAVQQDGPAPLESAPSPAAGDDPVQAIDREVLDKVKRAGLWEMPVGMWVSERGESARVREVGTLIMSEHAELNRITDEAAARLDVALPTEPSRQQKAWMREIEALDGAAFDERAVFLMRQTHGKVLPALAAVRAATQNAVIRQFTTESMAFVARHIEYLESTGLVNYEQLPGPLDVGPDDKREHAATFVVFALFVAIFIMLLRLAFSKLARLRKRPATGSAGDDFATGNHRFPTPTRGRHYARSYS